MVLSFDFFVDGAKKLTCCLIATAKLAAWTLFCLKLQDSGKIQFNHFD
jgi:hypothetical protein